MFVILALLACCLPSVFATSYRVGGYYPSYAQSPTAVNYQRYSQLTYFVFTTTSSPSVISQAGIDDSTIRQFVNLAKKQGVQVSVCIGGWTGSQSVSAPIAAIFCSSKRATGTSRQTSRLQAHERRLLELYSRLLQNMALTGKLRCMFTPWRDQSDQCETVLSKYLVSRIARQNADIVGACLTASSG